MTHPKLSGYTLPWTPDWAALFGTDRPLIVEIGFGNGDYLLALARAHPDCNIVGCEVSRAALDKTERKIEREGITNALAIYAPAELALHHLLEPASVREFHINYPDPWFKNRHAERRLIQRDTVDALANRLQVGGLLYVATDIEAYATMSDEVLQATPGLANTLDDAWTDDLPERLITTKYEQRGIRAGRPGKYFRYRRTADPAPTVPVKKELPMPHITLATPLPAREIAERVSKQTYRRDEIIVVLLSGFYSPGSDVALFEMLIDEPTIEQRLALLLAPKTDVASEIPHYTLKYANIGQPRATQGVHEATGFVADWIISLHEDAHAIARRIREP